MIDLEATKKCAIICVDEIINHLQMVDDDAAVVYWKEVKSEIENL